MSLDKRRHDGRLRDPWNIPHKNRMLYEVAFHLKDGTTLISRVGVPNPIEANLRKYRDEVIECNRSDWYRLRYAPIEWNEGGKPTRYGLVLDPKTGRPSIDCQLLSVSAKCLGADK